MPSYDKATLVLSFCGLLAATACFSQPIPSWSPAIVAQPVPVRANQQTPRMNATEVCGNGIDDDGNGLTDDNDFTCYYSSTTPGCPVTKIVWGISPSALYWIEPQTGTKRFVGNVAAMADLAWGSNGRLYAMNGNGIVELDPYTAQVLSLLQVPGYLPANAMTGDDKGNLYLTATGPPGSPFTLYVIKYSIATGQATPIVNLSAASLSSGGDLTFLNGYLYLACGGRKLAMINPANGSVQAVTVNSTVNFNGFGLFTMGDGFLYITDNNNLYRIDPVSLQSDATPYYTIVSSGVNYTPYGLSTYAEHCNAPSCINPSILVTVVSGPPYCSDPGVSLQAAGGGIKGGTEISWMLPNGTKTTGSTLLAKLSGIYTVRYHNVPDDCGHDTSFTLSILSSPDASLGNDTLLCVGGTLQLAPKNPAGITSWLWQDGSTGPNYLVSSPGKYTLQASNACGVSQASVQVLPATEPQVALPNDTEMCSFDSLSLKNTLHIDGLSYRWQDGSTAPELMARGPGIYWVDVSTSCRTIRDSIVIGAKKRGCERSIKIPNAFSPGGNGSNELFRPIVTGPLLQYEFMVYNRWGQLVFRTTNRNAGWDGRINGSPQATNVYVWSCRYRFSGLPAAVERGTVLLVK